METPVIRPGAFLTGDISDTLEAQRLGGFSEVFHKVPVYHSETGVHPILLGGVDVWPAECFSMRAERRACGIIELSLQPTTDTLIGIPIFQPSLQTPEFFTKLPPALFTRLLCEAIDDETFNIFGETPEGRRTRLTINDNNNDDATRTLVGRLEGAIVNTCISLQRGEPVNRQTCD